MLTGLRPVSTARKFDSPYRSFGVLRYFTIVSHYNNEQQSYQAQQPTHLHNNNQEPIIIDISNCRWPVRQPLLSLPKRLSDPRQTREKKRFPLTYPKVFLTAPKKWEKLFSPTYPTSFYCPWRGGWSITTPWTSSWTSCLPSLPDVFPAYPAPSFNPADQKREFLASCSGRTKILPPAAASLGPPAICTTGASRYPRAVSQEKGSVDYIGLLWPRLSVCESVAWIVAAD